MEEKALFSQELLRKALESTQQLSTQQTTVTFMERERRALSLSLKVWRKQIGRALADFGERSESVLGTFEDWSQNAKPIGAHRVGAVSRPDLVRDVKY